MTYRTDPKLFVWVHFVCQISYINMTHTTDPDFLFIYSFIYLFFTKIYIYICYKKLEVLKVIHPKNNNRALSQLLATVWLD